MAKFSKHHLLALSVVALLVIGLVGVLSAPLIQYIFFRHAAYSAPIRFWGKVVDEKGEPIEGANIRFEAIDHAWSGETSNSLDVDDSSVTDDNGRFSLQEARGIGVYVTVSKESYYQLGDKSMRGFRSGSADMPTPDHPAIFVLRKRGPTEPLLHIQRNVKIARDGTPIWMNLTNGQTSGLTSGDIQVQAWTEDGSVPVNSGRQYNWRCKILVQGGGLRVRDEEFDFQAPEVGYKESDEIVMTSGSDKWRDRADRDYFLKLGDGRYARIEFEIIAGGDHFFEIASYLNPIPNHRNLEGDSRSQP